MLLYFQVRLPKKGATKTVFAQAKQNTKMQWLYYAQGLSLHYYTMDILEEE